MKFLLMKTSFTNGDVKKYLGEASLKALGEFKIPKKTFKPVVELILNKPELFTNFVNSKIEQREFKRLFSTKEDGDAYLNDLAEELMIHLCESWLKHVAKVPHFERLLTLKDEFISKYLEENPHQEEYVKLVNQMITILEGAFCRWVECSLEVSVVGCNIITYEELTKRFIKNCFGDLMDRIEKSGIEHIKNELNQKTKDLGKKKDVSLW